MPRSIRIPKRHQAAFTFLATMDDSTFEHLTEALASTDATLDLTAYAERIVDKYKDLNVVEVTRLLRALAPLYKFLSRPGRQRDALIVALVAALKREDSFGLPEDQISNISTRLPVVLSFEQNFGAVAKGEAVYLSHERKYCESSIVTDIRPIFESDASKPPVAAVLVHTLKIVFHEQEGSEHREFFVALDTSELSELEENLKRAKQKAETTERLLESVHIPNLNIE